MISLEQIQALEAKVQAAVSQIKSLTAENQRLKASLQGYEERIDELQGSVAAFKADQEEIELGILSALEQLDELEDVVSEPLPTTAAAETPAVAEETPSTRPAESAVDPTPPSPVSESLAEDDHEPPVQIEPAPAAELPQRETEQDSPKEPVHSGQDAAIEMADDGEEPELDIF